MTRVVPQGLVSIVYRLDMDIDQALMEATWARIVDVLGPAVVGDLVQQQAKLLLWEAVKVSAREGLDALTLPRLRGLHTLVTEDLWPRVMADVADEYVKRHPEKP